MTILTTKEIISITVIILVLTSWTLFIPKESESHSANVQVDNPTKLSAISSVDLNSYRHSKRTFQVSPISAIDAQKKNVNEKTEYEQSEFIGQNNNDLKDTLLTTYIEALLVMDDTNGNEWNEDLYVEQLSQQYDAMTEEERTAQKYIQQLDHELVWENDYSQIDEFNSLIEEASINSILDLTCSKLHCRLAVQLADVTAQFKVKDQLKDKLKGWQHSVSEVKVNADDSRLLIVYYMQSNMGDTQTTE